MIHLLFKIWQRKPHYCPRRSNSNLVRSKNFNGQRISALMSWPRSSTTATGLYAAYESELWNLQDASGSRCLLSDANEAQERELAVEVEEQRQIQRPQPAKPRKHCVHQDVLCFIRTGPGTLQMSGLKPAFAATKSTTLHNRLKNPEVGRILLASADFLNTVNTQAMEDYQRSVNLILWNHSSSHCLVIYLFEAELLIPYLKEQKNVHMIHYSSPISSKRYISMDLLLVVYQHNTQTGGLCTSSRTFCWEDFLLVARGR